MTWLAYDVGRHVDESVHLFEEWGLPIWKTDESGERFDGSNGMTPLKDGGKPVRTGRWQIMINGESYKWIVAEATKKALGTDNIQEHTFIVRLVNDKNDPNRIAGAIGFSTRENKIVIYKAKAIMLAAGGCVNIFRPRSVGEGIGRAWYPVWNAGSTYAMAQGRLRPGGCLVPAIQVQSHQRDRRRRLGTQQGYAGRLPALWCGVHPFFLSA